jgi:hypothetical protein
VSSAWSEYAALASRLHDNARLYADSEELMDVAAGNAKVIREVATALKVNTGDLDVPAEVPRTDPSEALQRARESLMAALEANMAVVHQAPRSRYLPGWPAPARNVLVYVVALGIGLCLDVAWTIVAGRLVDVNAAGGGVKLLPLAFTPLATWLGAVLAIRRLFTPPMPQGPVVTSMGWGALICMVPLWLCCCVQNVALFL